MPGIKRSPRSSGAKVSPLVAAEGVVGVIILVAGLVTGFWLADLVGALAILFVAFTWVRTKQLNERDGDNGAFRS